MDRCNEFRLPAKFYTNNRNVKTIHFENEKNHYVLKM